MLMTLRFLVPDSAKWKEKLKPTRQGAMVVIGLLIFGLIILGGLYIAPRVKPPALPANIPMGAPRQRLRFVAYDLARQHPANDPMFAELAKLQPDYVLLQGVDEDDSIEIAQVLGMEHSFHPQLYQRSEHLAGRRGVWGNLTLSKQSLYEGAPLGGKRGGFGGWAQSVVDNHAFFIANLHLSPAESGAAELTEFQQAWKSQGSPPMVTAVLPSESKPPAGLEFLSMAPGSDGEFWYITREWTVVASGTASVSGTGLTPRWIDIEKASEENLLPEMGTDGHR